MRVKAPARAGALIWSTRSRYNSAPACQPGRCCVVSRTWSVALADALHAAVVALDGDGPAAAPRVIAHIDPALLVGAVTALADADTHAGDVDGDTLRGR